MNQVFKLYRPLFSFYIREEKNNSLSECHAARQLSYQPSQSKFIRYLQDLALSYITVFDWVVLSQNGVFIFVIQRKRSTNRWLVQLIGLCVSVVFRWNLIGALFEVGRWITIIIDYYKKYPHWLLTHSVHVVRVFLYINDTFLGFQYCCSIRVSFWRNLKWPIDFAWSDFRSETTRLFVTLVVSCVRYSATSKKNMLLSQSWLTQSIE